MSSQIFAAAPSYLDPWKLIENPSTPKPCHQKLRIQRHLIQAFTCQNFHIDFLKHGGWTRKGSCIWRPNRQQFSAETNGMLLPLTHVSLHLSMARNISWKQDNEKVVTKYMVTFWGIETISIICKTWPSGPVSCFLKLHELDCCFSCLVQVYSSVDSHEKLIALYLWIQ